MWHTISMLINVHVTTNAKEAKVTKVDEKNYEVRIDERAIEGRANKRLIEILSRHFGIPMSRIMIIRGRSSRDKLVQIL